MHDKDNSNLTINEMADKLEYFTVNKVSGLSVELVADLIAAGGGYVNFFKRYSGVISEEGSASADAARFIHYGNARNLYNNHQAELKKIMFADAIKATDVMDPNGERSVTVPDLLRDYVYSIMIRDVNEQDLKDDFDCDVYNDGSEQYYNINKVNEFINSRKKTDQDCERGIEISGIFLYPALLNLCTAWRDFLSTQ